MGQRALQPPESPYSRRVDFLFLTHLSAPISHCLDTTKGYVLAASSCSLHIDILPKAQPSWAQVFPFVCDLSLPPCLVERSSLAFESDGLPFCCDCLYRCGNVASILELDEYLTQEYKVFNHATVVRPFSLVDLSTPITFPRCDKIVRAVSSCSVALRSV